MIAVAIYAIQSESEMIQLSFGRRGFISRGSDLQPPPLIPHSEQTWIYIVNLGHTKLLHTTYRTICSKDQENIEKEFRRISPRFHSFAWVLGRNQSPVFLPIDVQQSLAESATHFPRPSSAMSCPKSAVIARFKDTPHTVFAARLQNMH